MARFTDEFRMSVECIQVCSISECVPLGAGLVRPTTFHSSPRKDSNTIIDYTCKVISTLFGLSQAKCLVIIIYSTALAKPFSKDDVSSPCGQD